MFQVPRILRKNSFTLIELLVVIAIVGILAGILIVFMTGATNNANDARRKADINQLVQAILIAKTQDGTLPVDSANCSLGSTCTGIQASLASKGITTFPKDPTTGNYYVYNRVSADDFTLTGLMSNNDIYSYSSVNSKYTTSNIMAGWSKKKAITITNSSGSILTDYQISLDISYDSDMQADFDDIRFTDSSVSTVLPYWIESKTDSSTAKIWVKVSSIPTTGTTIYLYYGNSSVASAANGDNTFVFFDDFNGTALDTTKWKANGGGTNTVSNSIVESYLGADTWNGGISTKSSYSCSAARYKYKTDHAGATSTWEYTNVLGSDAYFCSSTDTNYLNKFKNNSYNTLMSGHSSGAWHIFDVVVGSSSTTGRIDNGTSFTITNTSPQTESTFLAGLSGGTSYARIALDWVILRKYVSIEPTATLGNESSN